MRSRVVKPGFNFEYLMWLFTRISGIVLILLAIIGFVTSSYHGGTHPD